MADTATRRVRAVSKKEDAAALDPLEQMLAAISSFSMNKVAAFEGGQAHAHFEPRTRVRASLRAVA